MDKISADIHIYKTTVNSMAPERYGCNFESVIFKLISRIDISSILCEIVLKWMPQDLTED